MIYCVAKSFRLKFLFLFPKTIQAVENGKWARGGWAGTDEMEKSIKTDCGATLRCFPLDQPAEIPKCFYTGQDATEVAIFAKAY